MKIAPYFLSYSVLSRISLDKSWIALAFMVSLFLETFCLSFSINDWQMIFSLVAGDFEMYKAIVLQTLSL